MRYDTMPSAAKYLSMMAEHPPLAPYDPPEPAPQAAAWRQALKVIGCGPTGDIRPIRVTVRRATRHRC